MKHFIALLLVTFSLSLGHGDETDSYIKKYHKIFSGVWIDKASINSKVITEIKRGEKIKVFSKVKKATIKGITGYWVRVKTEDGTIGWCFDAYINEL